MLTATEAKTKSIEKSNKDLDKELQFISNLINDAVEEGLFAIKITNLSLKAKNCLTAFPYSYKVEYFSDQRENESYYTIRWN